MARQDDTPSMALFCDFENVALGVRDAKYDKFDIRKVLERLLLKGSIVVKKAYCDWNRYREFKAAMHEASFELIEIPHVRQSGKNSADIRMVVDALDLCYTKSHVDTFVIISGDSDFSPLVSKLRENAKTVIGVGVKGSTSDLLTANCDEFIFYDDLVREQRRRGAARDGRGESARDAVREPARDSATEPAAARDAGRERAEGRDGALRGRGTRGGAGRSRTGRSDAAARDARAGAASPGPETLAATGPDTTEDAASDRLAIGTVQPAEGVEPHATDARPTPAEGPASGASDAAAAAADDAGPAAAEPAPNKRAPRRRRTAAAAAEPAPVAAAAAPPVSDAAPIEVDGDDPFLASLLPESALEEPPAEPRREKRSEEERRQEALELAVETIEALITERGADDKIWGSMVKQTLKRRRPGFAESYYGYRSFNDLLEDARDRGLLALDHDEKSGGYVIRLL
jgi:uncharacterized protein (TIGR00288 family)